MNDLLDKGLPSSKPKQDLDTVNGVLAAGIVSIVLSLLLTGGLLSLGSLMSGIYAILKGSQAMSLFRDYPNDYTVSSLNRAKAGFVCGIIGVSIWGVIRLLVLFILAA